MESLFSQIEAANDDGDFDRVVQLANTILRQHDANDLDALKCKLTALLFGAKFEAARETIDGSSALRDACPFEYAYCLYRLNELDAAAKQLARVPDARGAGVLSLCAQIAYKKEEYAEAARCFRTLLASPGDLEVAEVATNLLSALIAGGEYAACDTVIGAHKALLDTSYEFVQAVAALAEARGQLSKARQLLQHASGLCQKTLSADGSDFTLADIDGELGPIRVQLAHVLQRCGHVDEANGMYSQYIASNPPASSSTTAVANNNMACVAGASGDPKQAAAAYKRLEAVLRSKEAVGKLTPAQRRALAFNSCVLLLLAGRLGECEKQTEALEAAAGGRDVGEQQVLLRAALARRRKQPDTARQLLEQYVDAHPGECTQAQMLLAQLLLEGGKVDECVERLRAIDALRRRPGMVGMLVALNERRGDIDGAIEVLDEHVEWLMEQGERDLAIMRTSGLFKLKHGHYDEAVSLFESAVKADKTSAESMALLVVALAHVDTKRAAELAEKLPDVAAPPDGFDVDSVLKSGPTMARRDTALSRAPVQREAPAPAPQTAAAAAADGGDAATAAAQTKAKKRRNRKPRYPKGFDPEHPEKFVKPDPERWLPMKDRSYYKPKKSKGGIARGAQGVVDVGANKSVTSSSAAAEEAAAPAKPAPMPQPKGKGKGGGGGGGKGKKGKNRRFG